MLKKLFDDVKKIKLTKTEKKIADFFFEKKDELFIYSSRDIADFLEISDTSIIRFVKILGFESYREFKNHIKTKATEKLKPDEKLLKNAEILASNCLELEFLKEIEKNIQTLFRDDIEKKFNDIEKFLKNSKKIMVVGFKSTSGISSFLGLRLGYIYSNVFTFSFNSSEVIKTIYDMEKDDVLILIAFPKYSKTYNILLDIAKEKKAKIIVITDSIASPYYDKGEISILAPTKGLSFFNSLSCAQILIEYLLTYLSKNLTKNQKKRVADLDSNFTRNI
ncbi:MAG: MurR/RpiR family transcriptional regulator [Cetobacterium sp.]